jgi:hypothetical protein
VEMPAPLASIDISSRLLKKSDFVRSSTLDARTVLNPNGNKQESKRLFDAPKNVFQQPARGHASFDRGSLGRAPPRATCPIVQSTRELPSSLSFLKKSVNFLPEA